MAVRLSRPTSNLLAGQRGMFALTQTTQLFAANSEGMLPPNICAQLRTFQNEIARLTRFDPCLDRSPSGAGNRN